MNIEQERAAFEAWYRLHHGSLNVYRRDASGEYADKQVQGAFNVWLARAALAAQQTEQQPVAPEDLRGTTNWCAAFAHSLNEQLAAAPAPTQQTEQQPVAPEDYKIPCDVMLPPATRIKRGCSLHTLMVAMAQRESLPPAQRVFAAAPIAQTAHAPVPVSPWIRLTDRMPNPNEHRRVLIYTEDYVFEGEQLFVVRAETLNESYFESPDQQPEVLRFASHWMPIPAVSWRSVWR